MQARSRSTCIDARSDRITTFQPLSHDHWRVDDVAAARDRLARARENSERAAQPREAYYGDRQQLEETIRDLAAINVASGLITRNHYGSLVLNAAHALFIDVDVCDGEGHVHWRSTFDDLRKVLSSEQRFGFRMYRTAAGFRLLVTSHEFEPGSPESKRLMEMVGADAAFVELCDVQNSFRARLTPKPWRCGWRRPPNAFPRVSTREQKRFDDWLGAYERACRERVTCRLVGHVGPLPMHRRVQPIVELHDRQTRALQALRLA